MREPLDVYVVRIIDVYSMNYHCGLDSADEGHLGLSLALSLNGALPHRLLLLLLE